jgi:hypothetical protein
MWLNSKAVQTISEYKPFKRTFLESSTISELKQDLTQKLVELILAVFCIMAL